MPWQDLRNVGGVEVRVGASGWDHLVPFNGSVAATLEVQQSTTRATADDLARMPRPDGNPIEALEPLLTHSGIGRHLVVYAAGVPDQILFFGYSGD